MQRLAGVKCWFLKFMLRVILCCCTYEVAFFVQVTDSRTVSTEIFMRSSFQNCAIPLLGKSDFAHVLVQQGWGRGTVLSLNKTARILGGFRPFLPLIMSVA